MSQQVRFLRYGDEGEPCLLGPYFLGLGREDGLTDLGRITQAG